MYNMCTHIESLWGVYVLYTNISVHHINGCIKLSLFCNLIPRYEVRIWDGISSISVVRLPLVHCILCLSGDM